jgi:hypothetical protein
MWREGQDVENTYASRRKAFKIRSISASYIVGVGESPLQKILRVGRSRTFVNSFSSLSRASSASRSSSVLGTGTVIAHQMMPLENLAPAKSSVVVATVCILPNNVVSR